MASGAVAGTILPVDRLTPYLRVRISTDDQSLTIEHRRAPLGFIPLWTHRIRIPPTELASADVEEKTIRLHRLLAAAVFAVSAFVLDLALGWRVVLGIVALLELPLALGPGKAVRVERTDGRSWTIPFCRTHEFDASLPLEDARRRRDSIAIRPPERPVVASAGKKPPWPPVAEPRRQRRARASVPSDAESVLGHPGAGRPVDPIGNERPGVTLTSCAEEGGIVVP
ncbi:MAG: hypothetical protein ACXVQT_10660 [Actinomycetota bacterium]